MAKEVRTNQPEKIPKRLKILPIAEAVLFPHTRSTIIRVNSKSFAKSLKEDKAFIIVHTFPEPFRIPEIGTLAIVTGLLEGSPNNSQRCNATFIERVNLRDVKRVDQPEKNEYTWYDAEWEIIVTPEIEERIWFDDTFLGQRQKVETYCKELCNKIRAVLASSPQIPKQQREMIMKDIKALLSALEEFANTNRDLFHIALDKTCNAILDLHMSFVGEIPRTVLMQYVDILFTIPVDARLTKVVKLAEWYAGNITKPIGTETSGDTVELIRNELAKPRAPKSKQPSVTTPENTEQFTTILDPNKQSPFKKSLLEFLGTNVINQGRAHEQIARKVVQLKMGRLDSNRPIIGGLFSGPTGVGKTESIKTLADFLFEDRTGYIHVPCHLLKERHQSSYLIGSPPGYVGYETPPLFSQWKLDRPYVLKVLRDNYQGRNHELQSILEEIKRFETLLDANTQRTAGINKQSIYEALKGLSGWEPSKSFSIVLLDELEETHPDTLMLFLRVFDDGTLNLMDGEVVTFSNTIFFATSNIYGREIASAISGRSWGIQPPRTEDENSTEKLQKKLYQETVAAAEKFFPPKLLGRIGKENIRVFHSMSSPDLLRILEEKELPRLAHYFKEIHGVELFITNRAKAFLVAEALDSTNQSLGVRALESIRQQKIEEVLTGLIDLGSGGGIVAADKILVDVEVQDGKERLVFRKK